MKLLIRKQNGAAWVEFIVVSGFVLVGLFSLIPFLGKLIDTKHKVEVAARYSAWERTIWYENVPKYMPNKQHRKSKLQLENEAQQRVFAGGEAVIDSKHKASLKGFKGDPLQSFQDRSNGKYESMLVKKSGTDSAPKYLKTSQSELNTPGGLVGQIPNALINVAGTIGSFDLNTKGFYTGVVDVEVKELKWVEEFKGIKPSLSSRSAILSDAWTSAGPSHAEDRTRGLLPQNLLAGGVVDKVQDVAGLLPIFKEIRSSSLEFGKVTSEPVPTHRLTEYRK